MVEKDMSIHWTRSDGEKIGGTKLKVPEGTKYVRIVSN
jgi:hypothetical protein